MRSKATAIYSSLLCNDYDIVIFTETWLNINFNSEEYFPPSYTVLRQDREPQNVTIVGGGIIVALKKELILQRVNLICNSGESLIVKIKCGEFWLFLIAVYIPFGSIADVYKGFMDFIKDEILPMMNAKDHILFAGDFNLPKITWKWADGDFYGSTMDDLSNQVLDNFGIFGTHQFNTVFNDHGRILDLVFSSLDDVEIEACLDLAGHSSIYHTPLLIKFYFIDFDSCEYNNNNEFKYDFVKANVASLTSFLLNVDWTTLFRNLDISDAVSEFYKVLNSGFDLFVPKKLVKSVYTEPWFNSRLKSIANRKSKAFKAYKRTNDINAKRKYCNLCKEFKILNDFLYRMYILQIENEICSNPKRFFSFINTKRKSQGYPRVMNYFNSPITGSQVICDTFANFFHSSFDDDGTNINLNSLDLQSSALFQFRFSEVLKGLECLKTDKGAGPDGITPFILVKCAYSVCRPLLHLFNLSLSTASFPQVWKLSFVVPIFKSGRRSDITCYRGISILSVIPKLFESLVKSRLEFHLKNRISVYQHGFLPGRSTITNLMSFSSHVFNAVGSREQVDVIYTDFSKAFDKLNHNILLQKLMVFGSDFIPVAWIASYLSLRKQYVKILGDVSFVYNVPSGVPQGSHLGPMLFIIFINDVVQCFNYCRCLLYADDLKMYANINSFIDTERLQRELDIFCNWCVLNKLSLNANKCNVLSFSRTRTSCIVAPYVLMDKQISRVYEILDLGIIFSSNLTFNKHIDYIISRAFSMLGLIKRHSREFHDPYTLRSLYVTYVRPVLEYASVIWHPFYRIHAVRIECIQKQFLIYALRRLPSLNRHLYVREPYLNRLLLINLQSLDRRREIACAVFGRDILCSRIDCPELLGKFSIYVPQRNLRSRPSSLRIPFCSTNFNSTEPSLKVLIEFNKSFNFFDFHISRELFKKRLL